MVEHECIIEEVVHEVNKILDLLTKVVDHCEKCLEAGKNKSNKS